ncbi:DUF2787 family protein [Photobacterium damselae]|uniref:DUF2787 family protein n=1 Tax=Photobacterium damselae TaxID=38293 RepID=UPI0010FE8CF4|nr:DUF2787 family protein [Photobacterium damselae]KAB1509634.1 DUF2787 domain-containing protein [Photobacterium damselae subsp. damselae]TLS74019.1 DUF2787 domain-containing protein [Photobacterium damselae subsp. damselae]
MLELAFAEQSFISSDKLKKILNQAIAQADLPVVERYTVSFKDTDYRAESGGFRPVEIAISQIASGEWIIEYITEFGYFGNYYPELERSVDFDISSGGWFMAYSGWNSLDSDDCREFYDLWENNFIQYVGMNAYDSITVTE